MKILKWLLILIILVIAVVGIMIMSKSAPDAPDITIEITPERLERGEYLVNNVSGCAHCHSPAHKGQIDWSVREKFDLSGGGQFGKDMGLPGNLYPANLTPYNLKEHTDGEIYRAITQGWGLDGRAMFPIMPYGSYSKMDKEDIYSIIAYIRSVPAVESQSKKSELDFPVNIIAKMFFPRDINHQSIPDKSNKVEYGKYLVNAGGCGDCHTPMPEGGGPPIEESYLSGGHNMIDVDGKSYKVKNLTPHEDGIKGMSEENFLALFRIYSPSSTTQTEYYSWEANLMPWETYSGMTDDDLTSIYAYLQSIEPKPFYNGVETASQ
jgi:hypothetical protein